MDLLDTHLYAVVGEQRFRQLVAAFYRRIPGDDIIGPMYERRDLKAAEDRLADFLIQRFGGPDTYSQRRGHPRLRMRHGPFRIDQKARDRWMELMEGAIAEADLPAEALPVLRSFLHDAATFLINHAGD
jgi:hemoglobin